MKNYFLPIAFLFLVQICTAQTTYMLSADDGVKVSVKGNSTLHEWEAVASEIIDHPTEITTDLKDQTGFKNFGFKVGVESLDGGRGASMNKKINKALVSSTSPYIIFNATEVEFAPGIGDDENMINSKGTLEIAGKSMDVEVDAKVKVEGEQLVISGSKALKMSDFDIEPPTAMFGQIKTRDDITVHFEFRYDAK